MIVKVCDALCGCGKTSSCINMMNEQTDRKFIFVTQYLDEVKRIVEGCKSRGFVAPICDEKTGRSKLSDIQDLIAQGRNIATTHALFLSYTAETKQLIQDQHYTLVLDEVVDVICTAEIAKCDIDLLRKSEMIQEDGEYVTWLADEYSEETHAKFRDEMLRAKSKNFLKFDDQYFFWAITPELFTSFDDVYVLTYLFESQNLKYFFDMYGISYTLVGTTKVNGRYQFCDVGEMDRRRDLRDKIHILDNERLNAIGEGRTALSHSWYTKEYYKGTELEKLQRHLSNVFKNIYKASARESLWTCFKSFKDAVSGKGYASSFISYNLRASNKYASRKYLAYCVNNFPRPWEAKYYREHGIEVDGDMYALSTLVQWVFRSAIRNNEEIWVYIPSARMRYIFTRWIDNLAEGKDLEPIQYKTPRKKYYKTKKERTAEAEDIGDNE